MKIVFAWRSIPGFRARISAALCLLVVQFLGSSITLAADPVGSRLVVALYPEAYNGSPGNALADRGIRSVFANGSREDIEIHNEYLDVSRFPSATYQQNQAEYLRRKYAGRKVDLIIAGLSSALDFAIKYREEVFPNVPIAFLAVDSQEVKERQLPSDVIGTPIRMDLEASLDLALRLHPDTQQVFVIVGQSKFDAYWEQQSRILFRQYEDRVKLVYLSGLPMADLLKRVEDLPDHSIAYYLHVFEDGNGHVQIPASALEQLSAAANVPFYSHSDSYIGRGIVGGRVFSFETAGVRAAQLGLRIFAGETPAQIGIQPASENDYVFDWRQLKRWGISESDLLSGSIVRFKEYTVWDRYQWHIAGVVLIVVVQSLLIAGLIAQRLRRRSAERELRTSQKDRQELTGKLIVAQESECRRIARELHDDFGQELALLSVEIDLLRQAPADTNGRFLPRVEKLSARVKQLSSTIHDLSHQLHPMKLEQLGLVAALGALCKELAESHSVSITFIHEQVPEPDRRKSALCLYRIAQEALRNVIKHSGARHCEVELRGALDAIYLRIHDDGKGFDPTSVTGQGGLGLVSMRERLRTVQGDITIDASPGRYTEIRVRVPLLATSHPSDQGDVRTELTHVK